MIDERWMAEWITFGQQELERYLTLQARFHDYCKERDDRYAGNTGEAGRPTVHGRP